MAAMAVARANGAVRARRARQRHASPPLPPRRYAGERRAARVATRLERGRHARVVAACVSCPVPSAIAVAATTTTTTTTSVVGGGAGSSESNIVMSTATLFEAGVEVSYLLLLVVVVGGIGYVGLQQLLIRRRLDLASKALQEKVRTGDATAEELFQYGAIMIEREYYSLAIKTLKQSVEKWEGADVEEAQIHNALGFALQKMNKLEEAASSFRDAIALCPEYVVAHRNLGDAYERLKRVKLALQSYEEALRIDPDDKTSREKVQYVRRIAERRGES